jgi:hypothetical protein
MQGTEHSRKRSLWKSIIDNKSIHKMAIAEHFADTITMNISGDGIEDSI